MADFYNHDVRSRCGVDAKTLDAKILPKAILNEQRRLKEEGVKVTSVMRGIGSLLLKMETEYGINACFLAAVAALESGWGTSDFAIQYKSIFAIGAYNKDPENTKEYGGATIEEGVANSVYAMKHYFIEKHKKYTINQFQSYPNAYAQLNDGTPTPHWAKNVADIWAELQGIPNTGVGRVSEYDNRSGSTSNGLIGRQWDWAKYELEPGDNLQTVAAKFKTGVDFLCKWNGITTSQVLHPGNVLRVYPCYTVVDGDTWNDIAVDFGLTIKEIKALNPGVPEVLNPGTKIRLPAIIITDDPPQSYDQVNRDTPDGASRYSRKLPLEPVLGVAPHVEDDEYPAHRTRQNPFTVRIGDVQLFLPPTSIKTSKEGFVDSRHVIRSHTDMMTRSGHTRRKIELELYFTDTDQINGYRVQGPNGMTYYMDGLRPLIAQFMKNPFLPIRNELLNDRHKIYNVAFHDLLIETDPDFPNVLVCRLSLLECSVEPLIQYPDFFYDELFMYPLFRWWYQQMLQENAANRLSARYLKTVPHGSLLGGITFNVLDREKVVELISNTNIYILSQIKFSELQSLMSPWPIGDAVLENVTVGMSKTYNPLHCDHHEIPVFQDLGGIKKEFILEFTCTNRAQLESLNNMVSHLEEMSRDFRHRFVSGFLQIDNEILNMCGIYNAMVVSMDTETLSEYDECFRVRLFCVGFDPTQKNHERVLGVNSLINDPEQYLSFSNPNNLNPETSALIENKTNRQSGVFMEAAVEEALNFLELYPDLELPTYDDVNKAIPAINKLRRTYGRSPLPMTQIPKPPGAVFVDPDFYFAYPDIKRAFETLEVGDFGAKFVNMFGNPDGYLDYAALSNEMDLGWWLDGQDDSLMKAWQDDAFKQTYREKMETVVDLSSLEPTDYADNIGTNWSADNPPPRNDELLRMMCHDMIMYNKRGRMVRAFPTYLILFVDEGQWLNGKRLWNNYYTYHAVHEISVVRDKDNPVDLAYVRMSNVYGAFDFSTRLVDPRDYMKHSYGILERAKKVFTNFYLTITEKTITERTQLLDHLKLKQGSRVHIRMGYGATASYLPICFNGQIATINEGDHLEMVCQGDGVELTRIVSVHPSGKLTNGAPLKEEPQNIFKQLLVSRMSDFWFAMSEDMGNIFNNITNAFGIEHFGYIESYASDGTWQTLKDLMDYLTDKIFDTDKSVYIYDVMKNIYRGTTISGFTDTAFVFDYEANIKIYPFGRTTWDIMQVVTLHTPEFICAPHVHGFHSTLFHGMPHWPVKYAYRRKRNASGKPMGDPDKLTSYEELYKPFQQFYTIMSGYDIIHNGIEVSSENLRHIAVGVYFKGAGREQVTTDAVYADRTIKQEIQKTMLVDTMVYQNLWGPEWIYDTLRGGAGWLFDFTAWGGSKVGRFLYKHFGMDPDLTDEQKEALLKQLDPYVEQAMPDKNKVFQPGFEMALAVTIGALQRNFMEMYQGELIIFGEPSIKPWDIFYLADEYNMIHGTAGVGKVTHTLSQETGFTTVIKPDLCVTRSDGAHRNWLYSTITKAGSALVLKGLHRLAMTKAAKTIAELTGGGTLWTARKVMQGAGKLASLTVGENTVRLAKQALDDSKLVKTGWSSLRSLTSIGTKALKAVKTNVVFGVILGIFTTKLEDWMRKELGFNNVIFIYPLWKAGKPFVAGISGYRHIIPNYIEPEWLPVDYIEKIETGDPEFKKPSYGDTEYSGSLIGRLPAGAVTKPVDPFIISSRFGMRNGKMHKGIDIAPLPDRKKNTYVRSIADGKVVDYGFQEEMGNYVCIQHTIGGEQYYAVYMHLAQSWVQKGDISAGDAFALMGNTGSVRSGGRVPDADELAAGAGTHLHLEISKGTKRAKTEEEGLLDPEKFLAQFGIADEKE
jgi:murein DD-endopeptidase MepM/ murein hydrolase activator NlpD